MSNNIRAELEEALRARMTLLWVITQEEARAEAMITDVGLRLKYLVKKWDSAAGLTDVAGVVVDAKMKLAPKMLEAIGTSQERAIFILRDLHPYLRDPSCNRALRNLARNLQNTPPESSRTVVVLTPDPQVPMELKGHTVVIDFPLPNRGDVENILDLSLKGLEAKMGAEKVAEMMSNGNREAAIDAAVGLGSEEIANSFSRSLVGKGRTIDPAVVASEKKRIIEQVDGLTYDEPNPMGMDAIGGLELAKAWLELRKLGFGKEAREFGLPAPKGVVLVGVSGTGKTLLATCAATAWGVPLLSLDLGAVKDIYVGSSERKLREVWKVLEAVGRCVLLIDEIEKSVAGSSGPAGDGGVAADQLGALLRWMQDRAGETFVIATANDVSALPPELLRKGRFDEIFFVDLPHAVERRAVLEAAIRKHGRDPEAVGDLGVLVAGTDGWNGAELASLVPEGLFRALADGARALKVSDLEKVALDVVPLSVTAKEKVTAVREWAPGRARAASRPPEQVSVSTGRALDFQVDE